MYRRSVLTSLGIATFAGLSGCLGDESSSGDGSTDEDAITYTVSSTVTIDDDPTPLSFAVTQNGETVTETDVVEFVFTVTNEGSTLLEIGSTAPPPFGVVELASETGSERPLYPWTNHYRTSDHVDTDGRDVVGAEDIGLTTEIEPGETIERSYTLSAKMPRLASGEYTFDQRYDVGNGGNGSNDTTVSVAGTIEIDSQGTES